MEGMRRSPVPVIEYLSTVAADVPFTLVDVGCSQGIEIGFRRFGSRLRAYGFDPNVAEVDRLTASETHSGISYIPAFAALPADHPFVAEKGTRDPWGGQSPWFRLSVARSLALLESRPTSPDGGTRVEVLHNVERPLAADTIVVPEFLGARGVTSVDFLKIDVDGCDFEVLHSFESAFADLGILAVGMEVNFYGSDAPTDHTFHNTDRFLRSKGFTLFGLTTRHYSLAALPSRYLLPIPAQSESGRIFQGDAIYARDLGGADATLVAELGAQKLLNLLCVFAVFELPDCAAEIALRHASLLEPHYDVTRILDLLATQAQGETASPLTYSDLIARYESGDPMFFPEPRQRRQPVASSSSR
jgi:FkbM family methyltransferase